MATKKAASTARTTKRPAAKKQTTTKVTTVKATTRPAAAPTGRPTGMNYGPGVSAMVAELVGTFMLTAIVLATSGQPLYVMFGLVGIVLFVGTLSGAYVNPALTIAGMVTRRLSWMRGLAYIVAQVLGAMLAFVVINAFFSGAAQPAAGAELYSQAPTLFKAAALPEGKELYVLFAEIIGTLIFGFAVAAATREAKERTAAALTVGIGLFFGLAIGSVAASYVAGGVILNPAIAVSLQALSFNVWPLAIYVLGSSVGAVLGFVLFDVLRRFRNVA